MNIYYSTKNGLLHATHVGAVDITDLENQGLEVHEGSPEEFNPYNIPFAGAKWHVRDKKWMDFRTEAEKAHDQERQVAAARHAAYPPLTELADALVHQSMGNEAPLEAYLAACREVKDRFPKPNKS